MDSGVSGLLSECGIQDPEDQSLYMIKLASKHNNNEDLDDLDMEIFKSFQKMGLGGREDEESRKHHMTYAFVSGLSLHMNFECEFRQGLGRLPGTICLYCNRRVQYLPSFQNHLAEHRAILVPNLIRVLLNLFMMEGHEHSGAVNMAKYFSQLFYSPERTESSGTQPLDPFSHVMSGWPSPSTHASLATNALQGYSHQQPQERNTHFSGADDQHRGAEPEAPYDSSWDHSKLVSFLEESGWSSDFNDQGESGDSSGWF